eukprot:ANDGO_03187.mRNA.1 ER membrane protein complex subunit 3
MSAELNLDPAIRTWVLVPVIVMMILFMAGRQYLDDYLKSSPRQRSPHESVQETESKMRQAELIRKSKRLRDTGKFVRREAFEMRKEYLVARLHDTERGAQEPVNPLMDPNSMSDMMKGNVTGMIPSMAMMGVFTTFFSGFVIVKFPFPLMEGFRAIVQRDINLPGLDVSYATSLSMYFLLLYGLRGIVTLLFSAPKDLATETSQAMMNPMMMMPGMGMPGQQQSVKAMLENEREYLELCHHDWQLVDAERSLLAVKVRPVKKTQ